MGDTIRIEHGFEPWQPSFDTNLVEVLAEFDVPTVGILESAGHRYLFWCVGDPNYPITVWAYSLLEDGEDRAFDSVTGVEAGYRLVSELMVGRSLTVAIAEDDEGVVFTAPAFLEHGGSVEHVAASLFNLGFRAVSELRDKLHEEMSPRAVG